MRRAHMVLVLLVFLATSMVSCVDLNCPAQCEKDRSFCSGTGVVSCAFNQNTQCLEWQLQPCAEGQTCTVQGAGALCGSEQSCDQKYFAKKCLGQDVYWFDNCGRQREKSLTCPEHTVCAEGICQKKQGGGCVSQCTAGDRKCTDSGFVSACAIQPDGCYNWTVPISCPPGRTCVGNQCQQGQCANPCAEGQARCSGIKLQSCRKEADGCFNWGPAYDCLPGQVCQNEQCVASQGPCQDQCTLGATQCSGAQLQACRKESNGCTAWGPPYDCSAGQICNAGNCVPAPCPASCQSDAECNVPACGTRLKCVNGTCYINTPNQCPPSCSSDTECNIAACGTWTSCVAGRCAQPQQPGCPASCTQDAQCAVAACGTRTSCTNGQCAQPQQPGCPASCTQDSQCAIAACGTRTSCSNGQCAVPSQGSGWKYGKNVKFFNFPTQNTKTNGAWGPVLTDIVQHEAPGDNNSYQDLVTLGHETTHGINNYVRNSFNQTGKKANGFYVLQSRAIILVEPQITMSDAVPYIPASLKGSRFQLYLQQQLPSWNDRPLYIYDEWVAYYTGTAAGVDLQQKSLWTAGGQDVAMGPLEFLPYGLAVAMAVEKKDPTHFQTNPQFLEFTAWLGAESMRVHREGIQFKDFQGFNQTQHLQALQTSADAKDMRDFCVRTFGQQWVDQVIFGKP